MQRTRHTSLTNLSVGHGFWRDKGGNVIWSSFWKQWEEFIAPSRERARKRCKLEKDCPFQLSAYNKMGKKADFNGYNAQIQTSYDLSNQQHQNITHTGNGVKRIRHNSQYLSNDHDCKIQQKATAVPAVCKMQSGKVLGKRKHAMTSNFVNIALLNYSLESEVKDDMLSQDSKPTTTYPVSTDKRSLLSTDIFRKNVKKSKFGKKEKKSEKKVFSELSIYFDPSKL